MNEDEVEAWAVRMMRIWDLRKVDQWGFFDGHRYLEAHCDSQTTLDINPLIEMNCCSLIQHPSVLGSLEDGEIYVQSIEGDSTDEVTKERHRRQFAEDWMPRFRRGCWLMGYGIAASDEEKAQWQRSFTDEGEVAPPPLLSEKMRWERRRVAAAFGVHGWKEQNMGWSGFSMRTRHEDVYVSCFLDNSNQMREWTIQSAENGNMSRDEMPSCRVVLDPTEGWWYLPCTENTLYNELMARGLYRLGIEDRGVKTKLNVHLAELEKLELRHSMPREFWPKKWLEEEA